MMSLGERWIQRPTVLLLNAALLACIALLVFLLGTSLVHNPPLALHFALLLVFAVGLLASVNWCALTSDASCRILAKPQSGTKPAIYVCTYIKQLYTCILSGAS